MSNTSLDLSNRLPAEQVDIIRQVVHAAKSQQLCLFIVGAQARDLLLQYVYDFSVQRATNDIDFGVIVENWGEFHNLREKLLATEKFQSHRAMTHRLIHESGLPIDLVPFGDLEEVSGQISWPPDFSIVMSTVGFREAFDNAVEVRAADNLFVSVASLSGLALMKIVAWNERRFERDAQDLALIIKHYLAADNEKRVYNEQGDCFDLLDDDFDYGKASARILGRDVGRILTEESRQIVERALSGESAHGIEGLAMVMIRNEANYHGDYDLAVAVLAELRAGVREF